jgi:hypothetical protein
MCYLCLVDQFHLAVAPSKLDKSKERALEIKSLLKIAETDEVCDEGNKVIDILKEEQYKLSREM